VAWSGGRTRPASTARPPEGVRVRHAPAREATGLVDRVPTWLLADHDEPERDEIAAPADEKLIVEFYAK